MSITTPGARRAQEEYAEYWQATSTTAVPGVRWVPPDRCPFCGGLFFMDGLGYKVCSRCGNRQPLVWR